MKKAVIISASIIAILALFFVGCLIFYNSNLKPVSNDDTKIDFMVDSGSTYYDVIAKLKKEGLIKNEFCFKIYIKLNHISSIEAGTYSLSKSMSVKEITSVFSLGNTYNPDAIVITFKEGKNLRSVADTISKYTNNTVDQVYNLLKDKDYLNSLINDYWFIDSTILDDRIYYSLEGYLYPNTYEFKNKDVSIKDIFKTMLDEMDLKLTPIKEDLEKSTYSIHEILTLASIVELEGKVSSDRAGIAGVFYNRLNNNMPLGSDVTTYYAAKIDLSDRDLYKSEIEEENDYNTRSNYLAGKLPIGPICNPSIDSIKASLYPKESDYFYFVSDIQGNVYFSKTYSEHLSVSDDLKKAGLWYTYD